MEGMDLIGHLVSAAPAPATAAADIGEEDVALVGRRCNVVQLARIDLLELSIKYRRSKALHVASRMSQLNHLVASRSSGIWS